MSKHNIFEFKDRDTFSDALSEMLRTRANQLIHQAVQIELEELLATNAHRLTPDGKAAVVRNGYQPQRRDTDRHWAGDSEIAQGQIKGRRGSLFSFFPGTTLCSKKPIPGSGIARALSERCINW